MMNASKSATSTKSGVSNANIIKKNSSNSKSPRGTDMNFATMVTGTIIGNLERDVHDFEF